MSGLGLLLILILFSSLPAAAVYLWFRVARYPFSLLMFLSALFAGGAAFFPAFFLQQLFPAEIWITGRRGLFIQTFIRVALIEELSRLLVLLIFFGILRQIAAKTAGVENALAPESFSTFIQGSAVGLIAGLGFAIFESAAYSVFDANIVIIRALTAAPLHGACGSRVGSAAIMFREHPVQAVFRILSAAAIHGIYNFMIVIPGFPSIIAVLIALSALASAIISIRGGLPSQQLD